MKILFLCRLFYPHTGGVEKHVYEIGKRFVKNVDCVSVLTTKHDKELDSLGEIEGIKIIRFHQPAVKYFGLIYTWYWIFKNINYIKEHEIIHIHDVFIWYLPFRLLLPHKKVFMTFHGQWGHYPISRMDKILKILAEKLTLGSISIGEYIPANYKIQTDCISYGAATLPKSIAKKEKNTIIYVGRLDKELTLDIFIEVFRKLKGFKIIFIGDGELRSKCEKIGKVYGFCDPSPFYKKAKYVFASGYLTIIEALSNKCLVITAYQNPLHRDYYKMTPFKEMIICKSNATGILKSFDYYRNNEKKSGELIEKGYNWAKHQTWKRMVNNYTELWHKL